MKKGWRVKEWQGISEFVATAETNSFSAASQRLGLCGLLSGHPRGTSNDTKRHDRPG